MTDDLVKRLRVGDYYPDGDIGYHEISPGKVDALCEQAADRIEALTAELKTVLDREADTHRRHDAKIETLEAENERLREALMAAPIIGAREGQVAFKSRQDEWLKTKYREALEKQP
jgi:hypothetical protein